MRTDVAIEKLCNVAPVVADLSEKLSKDTEFKNVFLSMLEVKDGVFSLKKDISRAVFVAKLLPLLLKNYAAEAYEILSVWNEKSVEEIKAQPFAVTVRQVKSLFEDEDIRSFFTSSTANEETLEE